MSSINEEYIRKKCYESESLTGGEDEGSIIHFDCEVIGDSCSGGCKIILIIVTNKFDKLSLIKRHRIINEIFATELKDNSIHALTIKGAYTPSQWEIKKTKENK
jgi:acid stress-induced BolA-like protein IbaG/YrbA